MIVYHARNGLGKCVKFATVSSSCMGNCRAFGVTTILRTFAHYGPEINFMERCKLFLNSLFSVTPHSLVSAPNVEYNFFVLLKKMDQPCKRFSENTLFRFLGLSSLASSFRLDQRLDGRALESCDHESAPHSKPEC